MMELCMNGPDAPAALIILAAWTALTFAIACRMGGKCSVRWEVVKL
jgi:hypothetical protein